jgi:hypothetical protein
MDTQDDYTPEEAERRARETAHRLLNTPYRPHRTLKQEAELAAKAASDRAAKPRKKVRNR